MAKMTSAVQRWRDFLVREREVLFAFFASRLLLWAFGWMAAVWLRAPGAPKVKPLLWDLLYRWDAAWYASIVKHGYSYTPGAESNVPFFPLLPLLALLVRGIFRVRVELAGFIVANAALLASAILLRRLLRIDYPSPSRVPERAVWLLLFCPMTFFHSAFYTESLFLALSLAVFLFAREKRWLAVGVSGAFLSMSRGNALIIMLPLLYEAFVERRDNTDVQTSRRASSVLWLSLVPAGLVAFAIYLHFAVGDALAFGHAHAAWGRHLAAPWVGIRNALAYVQPSGWFFISCAIVALLLCVLGWWMRLRVSYQLYAAASVLFLMSSSMYHALPRLLSVIFPLYIAVAVLGERCEPAYLVALSAGAVLMGICLSLWVGGYALV